MTDPGVDMFCTQICSVGIIAGCGPVYHLNRVWWWSSGDQHCSQKKKKNHQRWLQLSLVLGGAFFSFSCSDSKYLFCQCSWPEPVTSPWSLMILPWFLAQGCQAGSTAGPVLVIHRLLDRLPQCIDFCFPNLQERSKEKIKTLSVWRWIRILHRGDTLESMRSQLRHVHLFIDWSFSLPLLQKIHRVFLHPQNILWRW